MALEDETMNAIHQPPLTGRAAFSIAEVLAQTGLGRDRIYKLIGEQKLIARKCGRRTIILAADLEAFLQSLPAIGRAA
jgi:excisionase family DNA binding protein